MGKKKKDSVKKEEKAGKPEEKGIEALEEKKEEKVDEFARLSEKLPKEAQKKLKDIKEKLDKFQAQVIKKFDKYIIGIALLPPKMPEQNTHPSMQMPQMPPQIPPQIPPQQPGEIKEVKDQINVLVLIDDSDSKKMAKEELKSKLSVIIRDMAKEIDPNLVPQPVILSELWQSCYDGKYDVLQMVAVSAPVFDTGMIAAIKIANLHKEMVLKKFERYIVSYVLAGSLIQGRATDKSDIDVFIVIDDTDVKRMTRAELKDKLRAIIIGMGFEAGTIAGIKNKINIQVYILTEFWDSIREANPIIFTFLRDGVPFYDRGIFMPWKQLLQMGRIRPSSEAIDLYMSTGEQMLNRVKFKMKDIGMEDIFYALLTPTQAAIMLYGVSPPTPKETPEVMRDVFVNKKLIEENYVKLLEKVVNLRKDLEHGTKKEVTGKEIDELLSEAQGYLKRIDQLFKEIQKVKEEESMLHVYDSIVTMIRDVLKMEGVERVEDSEIVKIFEKELVSQGKIPAKFLRMLNSVIKAKKDYDDKKLTKAEVEKVKKESDTLVKFLVEYMQRKRGRELERAKIRVKHGSKYGEVILLDKEAFIIHDIDSEEKDISKATLLPDGRLGAITKSTLEEFEQALAKTEIPGKVFIKEPIFEDLKNVFGRDVEVLVNY